MSGQNTEWGSRLKNPQVPWGLSSSGALGAGAGKMEFQSLGPCRALPRGHRESEKWGVCKYKLPNSPRDHQGIKLPSLNCTQGSQNLSFPHVSHFQPPPGFL